MRRGQPRQCRAVVAAMLLMLLLSLLNHAAHAVAVTHAAARVHSHVREIPLGHAPATFGACSGRVASGPRAGAMWVTGGTGHPDVPYAFGDGTWFVDPDTLSWVVERPTGEVPSERGGFLCLAVNEHATVLLGGEPKAPGRPRVNTTTLYVLNVTRNAWFTIETAPNSIHPGDRLANPSGVALGNGTVMVLSPVDSGLWAIDPLDASPRWRLVVNDSALSPRKDAMMTAHNNTLYLLGGAPSDPAAGDVALSDVWSLSLSAPGAAWTQLTSSLDGVFELGVAGASHAVLGDDWFFLGGRTTRLAHANTRAGSGAVIIVSLSTMTAHQHEAVYLTADAESVYTDPFFDYRLMRFPQRSMAAFTTTADGTTLVVFGGLATTGHYASQPLSDLWRLNMTTERLERPSRFVWPHSRRNQAIAPFSDSQVIMFGGKSLLNEFLNDLWVLSFSSKEALQVGTNAASWHALYNGGPGKHVPAGRDEPCLLRRRDEVFVFGGDFSGGASDFGWTFNLTTNTWHRLPATEYQPPVPRWGHFCAVNEASGRLFLHGGQTDNIVHVYSFTERVWQPPYAPPSGAPPLMRQAFGTFLNGHLWVLAGPNAPTPHTVWRLSADGSSWTRLELAFTQADPNTRLDDYAIAVIPNAANITLVEHMGVLRAIDFMTNVSRPTVAVVEDHSSPSYARMVDRTRHSAAFVPLLGGAVSLYGYSEQHAAFHTDGHLLTLEHGYCAGNETFNLLDVALFTLTDGSYANPALPNERCSFRMLAGPTTAVIAHVALVSLLPGDVLKLNGVSLSEYDVGTRDVFPPASEIDVFFSTTAAPSGSARQGFTITFMAAGACKRGSFVNVRTETCEPCPPQTFTAVDNSIDCQPCPHGTYAPTVASTTCKACVDGQVPVPAGTHCEPCPRGRFQTGNDCLLCPKNHYANESGLTACRECSAGSRIAYLGATAASSCDCVTGFYTSTTDATAGECMPCPQGAKCSGGTVQPQNDEGWWPLRNSSLFLECHPAEACPQGGGWECATGYEGERCSSCAYDFVRVRGAACRRCPSVSVTAVLFGTVVFLLLAFVLGCFYVFTRSSEAVTGTHAPRTRASLGIFVDTTQILYVLTLLNGFEWPTVVSDGFSAAGEVMTLSIGRMFFLGCFFTDDFIDSFRAKVVAPFMIVPAVGVLFFLLSFALRADSRQSFTACLAAQRRKRDLYASAVFFIVNIGYTKLSLTSFEFFSCVALLDGRAVLAASPDVECWTGRHRSNLIWGIIAVLMYPIGIPAMFWSLFRLGSEGERVMPFITGVFSRRTRWWFVIVFLRKLFVVCVRSFAVDSITATTSGLLPVLILCVVTEAALAPYRTPSNNALSVSGLCLMTMVLLFGTLHHSELVVPSSRVASGWLLLTLLLLFAFGSVAVVLKEYMTDMSGEPSRRQRKVYPSTAAVVDVVPDARGGADKEKEKGVDGGVLIGASEGKQPTPLLGGSTRRKTKKKVTFKDHPELAPPSPDDDDDDDGDGDGDGDGEGGEEEAKVVDGGGDMFDGGIIVMSPPLPCPDASLVQTRHGAAVTGDISSE